ncbi:2-keto-4-pentenoate hydratase [Devosia crocina]|uniref:2-keto-4-pentenoate hydratase n=1 Tax=Devosia crocina TaxID=429728 RepID=A0A1I7NUP4_9HYPH|nr:fumarylacetoacetate hydrolase family protein [Devosia crocina]SFV38350.1 2-keto-4-pentenoate hydratase [Devosia crocina]
MTQPDHDIAQALIAAHDGGPLVGPVAEHDVPADIPAIHALQDRIMAGIGPAGGWKIGAGLGAEPPCSPIPANRYFEDGATLDAKCHRLIITEVELALKLGADIEASADEAHIEAAIASIHPALEMVGNPFVDRSAMPRNLQLGDLQSNGAVIVGAAMDRSVAATAAHLPIVLRYGDRTIKEVETGASWADILAAVKWLAPVAERRGMGLKAGQVIITGARIAVPLEDAVSVTAQIGDWGQVSAAFTY